MLRYSIRFIGIVIMLMGLLWVAQGLGLIAWPAESFMLADRTWAIYGGGLAILGFGLFYAGHRKA